MVKCVLVLSRGSPRRCAVVTATHLLHFPLYDPAPIPASKRAPVSVVKRSVAPTASTSPPMHSNAGKISEPPKRQSRQQPPPPPQGLLPPEWLSTPPATFATPERELRTQQQQQQPFQLPPMTGSKPWPGHPKSGGNNNATAAAGAASASSPQKAAVPPRFVS